MKINNEIKEKEKSYMQHGMTFYGSPIEQIYLWSNLSFIKRFFLFPIYFSYWIWMFLRYYFVNNIYVEIIK